MPQLDLPQGPVTVHDTGGTGPTIVLVHGLLVDSRLWRKVVPLLEGEFRVVVPDLPLGAHRTAMRPDADLTPPGLAGIIADVLEALDLRDVTLVGNDTGGALCQIMAAHRPERLGGLVLTPCDAYENFLPPLFRPLQWLARVPGLPTLILQPFRLHLVRRSPLFSGLLVRRPIDREVLRSWVQPALGDRAVRRDLVKALKGIHPRHTLEAARRLRDFDRPVLLAWAPEDRLFTLRFAERLAADIPNARIERIADSRTFVMEDQPERTAALIAAFARERVGRPVSPAGR